MDYNKETGKVNNPAPLPETVHPKEVISDVNKNAIAAEKEMALYHIDDEAEVADNPKKETVNPKKETAKHDKHK